MSRKHIYLKCETEYYQDIESGKKKFELRKDDRGFEVGCIIHLQETVHGEYTGRKLPGLEIQYMLKGGKYGLDPRYCILNW